MEFCIKTPTQRFGTHLSIKGNDRIILSGRFGSGKTYFLRKYFENNDNYEVIHLYPINYSVASNKDVFELVKYDILFELLGKDVTFDKLEIPNVETFIGWAAKNSHNILAPFLNLLPVLGKSLFTIYEKLNELSEDYLKKHDAEQVDEKKKAVDFLEGFTLTQGCIYEDDFFTQLIKQLVTQLKCSCSGDSKETILIIDDLDRIDPEHIFRLLNVFAAHSDIVENGNKFNFDKIILVCDIKNIRNVFSNRYGSDVDFAGYIDKFYSKEIFDFENLNALNESVWTLLQSIEQPTKSTSFDLKERGSFLITNVAYILTLLILHNLLTVRNINKIIGQSYYVEEYKLNLKHNNVHFDFVNIVDFLVWLYGDFNQLIEAIKKCKDVKAGFLHDGYKKMFCCYLIPLLDYKRHSFDTRQSEYVFLSKISNESICYTLNRIPGERKRIYCDINSISKNGEMIDDRSNENIGYVELLVETLELCKNERILRYS